MKDEFDSLIPQETPPPRSVILLVEDEVDLLTVISSVLEKDGHQVLRAQNGQEALDLLDEHSKILGSSQVDLVISDLRMPIMDGFTLLQKLRRGSHRKIAVLILSGTLDMQKVSELITLGVDGILYKPFHPSHLLSEVDKSLQRRTLKNTGLSGNSA